MAGSIVLELNLSKKLYVKLDYDAVREDKDENRTFKLQSRTKRNVLPFRLE